MTAKHEGQFRPGPTGQQKENMNMMIALAIFKSTNDIRRLHPLADKRHIADFSQLPFDDKICQKRY